LNKYYDPIENITSNILHGESVISTGTHDVTCRN